MKRATLIRCLWAISVAMPVAWGAQPPVPPVPAPATPPAAPPAATNAPRIQFASTVHDFGKIGAGETVRFEYILTNVGTANLEITHVQPSCGCTTASTWERVVPPGKTARIPIQFNSQNFSGPVTKTVTVTCNDPVQPVTVLQLKGTIWKPIDVIPQYVYFTPSSDAATNETRSVRIVNNTEEEITLSEPEVGHKAFAAELKTLRPGKEFELIVRTVPPLPQGSVQGPITIKTSMTNLPPVTVNAIAVVQPAVLVMPSQVMLPAGPLATDTRMGVTIRNNSSSNLVVSDHAINVDGVSIQRQEPQPGRLISFIMTFPKGFEIKPGQQVEFTAKTSHPQYALLKVPVFQAPRPTVAPFQPPVAPPGGWNRTNLLAPQAPTTPRPPFTPPTALSRTNVIPPRPPTAPPRPATPPTPPSAPGTGQ